MNKLRNLLILAIICGVGLGVASFTAAPGRASAALSGQTMTPGDLYDVVGQAGGSFKAIEVQGNYAYAAIGPRLAVLEMTDGNQPVLKGQSVVLPVDIQRLAIQGDTVYATAGSDGLYIFDVSDPTQPVVTGSLGLPGFATRIVVSGTHAFVATDAGLRIVEVSQPAKPQEVGMYLALPSDMAIAGSVLYLACGDHIIVLDISNPTHPNSIVEPAIPADEIEIEGGLAYVEKVLSVWDGGNGHYLYYGTLRILDVSALPGITQIYFSGSEYDTNLKNQLREMRLYGNKLFGYDFNWGRYYSNTAFGSIDVANPANPTLAYTPLHEIYQYGGQWEGGVFGVGNQRVWMATSDTLHIFDSASSTELGLYFSWSANKVSVDNGIAYVAAGLRGLVALDVSIPEQPLSLDTYKTTIEEEDIRQPANISNLAIYGPYVYVEEIDLTGSVSGQVEVLDISNSAEIASVAAIDWYMFPQEIYRGYGYFFYWDYINTGSLLKSIDLANPAAPVLAAAVGSTYSPSGLALAGSYAYVTGLYQGLQIVDIADPYHFFEVKRLDGPIYAWLIDSTDEALFIITEQALKIYSLADPENPFETSSTTLNGDVANNYQNLMDMKVTGNTVFLAQRVKELKPFGAGLRIFDVTDLNSPANNWMAYTRPGSTFASIDVVGNLVFIASPEEGLLILRNPADSVPASHSVYLPFTNRQALPLPTHCIVAYHTSLQNQGWLDWTSDWLVSGMPGKRLYIEALQVELCDRVPRDMSITYQAYVREIGWMDWVSEGQATGTTGQQKQVEAVRFKLLNPTSGTHIRYRAYVGSQGWTQIATDGEIAGTTSQGKWIEAIQIELEQP